MRWELFEVVAINPDGREEVIETTKSLKEAREMAEKALRSEGAVEVVLYREVDDIVEEFERISR